VSAIVSETPLFFPDGSGPLFGVFHSPAEPTREPFVFCHPFAEEKLWTHRVFVSFARALAQRGHPVLRFDYRGNGDSLGTFAESSVETALADIATAIDEARRRTGADRVALLGLRWGATLAAAIAEQRTDISRLALWAPILDGGRYLQDLLRINLTTQMAVYKEIRQDRAAIAAALRGGGLVNIDGYDFGLAMYEGLGGLSLTSARGFAGPSLVVQIERTAEAQPAKELRMLADSYGNGELAIVQEEPFWKEIKRFYGGAPNLFDRTLAWTSR
jgi:exosortase A-associated hydrolase 2